MNKSSLIDLEDRVEAVDRAELSVTEDRERLNEKTPALRVMRQSELPYSFNDMKGEREIRSGFPAYQMNSEHAYLLGCFLGDGTLGQYSMRLKTEDRDIVEHTAHCLRVNFGLHPNVTNSKGYGFYWALQRGSPALRFFLNQHCGKEKRWPFVLDAQPTQIKHEFIAGLMDTDGTICNTRRATGYSQFCMAFGNTAKWTPKFVELLQSVGVKTGRVRTVVDKRFRAAKDLFHFTLNVRSFAESGCFFRCQRKQALLNEYVQTVARYNYA